MPQVAAAVAALDPAHVAEALREGRTVGIALDGAASTRSARTTCSSRCSRSRATSSSARARTPSRSTCTSTTSCAAAALAREVVHAVQNARKGAGLAVEDRIALTLAGDAELLDAVREHEAFIAGETLATLGRAAEAPTAAEPATIEGRELR